MLSLSSESCFTGFSSEEEATAKPYFFSEVLQAQNIKTASMIIKEFFISSESI
jgi:hypothetical protein